MGQKKRSGGACMRLHRCHCVHPTRGLLSLYRRYPHYVSSTRESMPSQGDFGSKSRNKVNGQRLTVEETTFSSAERANCPSSPRTGAVYLPVGFRNVIPIGDCRDVPWYAVAFVVPARKGWSSGRLRCCSAVNTSSTDPLMMTYATPRPNSIVLPTNQMACARS